MYTNSIKLICIVIILALVELGGMTSYAQHDDFNTYTDDDGLPSNDVYDLLSAKDGYMWFATDNGVSRYDGNVFMNLSVADGIPDNTIIRLYEDYRGRIWFQANNGMLSYFEAGSVIPYRFNDSIVKYWPDHYINKIVIDTLGNVIISPRGGGKGIIDKIGNVEIRSPYIRVNRKFCYLSFEDLQVDHFITIQPNIPASCNESDRLMHCDGIYFLKAELSFTQFHRNFIKIGEDEYLVSYRNTVFYIKDHEIVSQRTFEDEVLSLFLDSKGYLMLSIKFKRGMYRFQRPDMTGAYKHYLDGYTVSSVIQDIEGGYWIATEGYGVFFTPGFSFNNYSLPNDNRKINVMAMALAGDRLWFSTRNKEVYFGQLSSGTISNIRKLQVEEPYDWIKSIAIDHEGYLWLSSTKHMRYDPAGFPKPLDTIIQSNFLGKTSGDTIIVASNRLAYYYGSKMVRFITPDPKLRIYSSLHTNGVVYLGTLYGLHVYDQGRLINISKGRKQLSERINCVQLQAKRIIVGTATHGVIVLSADTIYQSISDSNGLINNNVRTIYVENDSVFWVGTNGGLNKVSIGKKSGDTRIESYTMIDGLPANEIQRIVKHDGYIWLATSNGLSSFNPLELNPYTAPPSIRINSILINGRDTVLSDEYLLDHDQNDIRINFSGITYRHKAELKYRYFLANFNDEIVPTRNNWANFPNLPPGDYYFNVNVGNNYNSWNDEPRTIHINISKHYTQTLGFMIFLVLFSSSIMVGITIFFQKQRKIKEKARTDMARMEQKIFRLQMNPHFVFNALLAIQGFMYQQNSREAGRYLTSFAKLIRHTLYGSREELVSLNNELEAMKYYLELQRLRFNDNFDFTINIGENVFPEVIKIPPLLIQPFLENAIEHGLQHKKEGGKLILAIRQEKGMLFIEIEDNGIGRDASYEIQKKKGRLHKSLGMEIVKSRLDSLNKVVGKKIMLDILDLKDDENKARGTLIRISMPA